MQALVFVSLEGRENPSPYKEEKTTPFLVSLYPLREGRENPSREKPRLSKKRYGIPLVSLQTKTTKGKKDHEEKIQGDGFCLPSSYKEGRDTSGLSKKTTPLSGFQNKN